MKKKVQVWIRGWSADRELRLLLLRLVPSRGGFWQPVTGHVDPGETLEDAAHREAREETGILFHSLPRALHHAFQYEGKFGATTEHVFSLETEGTPAPLLSPDEHDAWEWLTPDAAKERVPFPVYREMISRMGMESDPSDSPRDLSLLRGWRVSTFLALLIGYIGYYLCRANLSAALPLMSSAFGYTNTQLGVIGLYSELAYAAGKFINGPIADRYGGKRIFLLGFLGAIAMNILFSFGTTLFYFTLIWCICRYFLSMGWGGILKVVGNWYEKKVFGTAMGVMSINFQFGGVLALLLCGVIVDLGGGWRSLFLIPAAMGFAVFLLSALASRDSPQEVVPGTRFAGGGDTEDKGRLRFEADETGKVRTLPLVRTLLKDQVFRHVLLFSFLTTILRIFFLFWTPKFLVDVGMGNANAILKSAIFPALGCVGTVLIGWWTDRHAKDGNRFRMVTVMLVGLVASLACLSVIAGRGVTLDHGFLVVLLGAAGFFLYGPYSMSAGVVSLDIAGPRGAATAAGIVDCMGYIGGALATWGAGILTDSSGGNWGPVFWVMTGMAFLSVLSSWVLSRLQEKAKMTP